MDIIRKGVYNSEGELYIVRVDSRECVLKVVYDLLHSSSPLKLTPPAT